MDDLKIILDRIRKPLTFATRDNFAHLKSLAALESFMHAQIGDLKRLDEDRREIVEIENLFSGFDTLPPDQKKEHIIQAIAVIDSLDRRQLPLSGMILPSSIAKASAPSGLNCF
jgi:hypothetical protein